MLSPEGRSGPGGGVRSLGVERVRDMFIDFQFREGEQSSGRLEARAALLARAEIVLAEPGESGLRSALSRYWNAWRDIATSPESSAARTVLVQAGDTLAVTARRVHDSLVDLRADANTQILAGVDEINGLTQQIHTLNEQIARLTAAGAAASDLRDQRDLALDRLARLVDVNYLEHSDGRVDVFVGGHALVSSSRA